MASHHISDKDEDKVEATGEWEAEEEAGGEEGKGGEGWRGQTNAFSW
jgi:hypothetical protein